MEPPRGHREPGDGVFIRARLHLLEDTALGQVRVDRHGRRRRAAHGHGHRAQGMPEPATLDQTVLHILQSKSGYQNCGAGYSKPHKPELNDIHIDVVTENTTMATPRIDAALVSLPQLFFLSIPSATI